MWASLRSTADGIYVSGGSGHTIQANLVGTNDVGTPFGNYSEGDPTSAVVVTAGVGHVHAFPGAVADFVSATTTRDFGGPYGSSSGFSQPRQ